MLALSQESDVFCLGICGEKTNTDAVFAAQGVFAPNLGLIWEGASSQSHVADVNSCRKFCWFECFPVLIDISFVANFVYALAFYSFSFTSREMSWAHMSIWLFWSHWCHSHVIYSLSLCTKGVGAGVDCAWMELRSELILANYELRRSEKFIELRSQPGCTCLTGTSRL